MDTYQSLHFLIFSYFRLNSCCITCKSCRVLTGFVEALLFYIPTHLFLPPLNLLNLLACFTKEAWHELAMANIAVPHVVVCVDLRLR